MLQERRSEAAFQKMGLRLATNCCKFNHIMQRVPNGIIAVSMLADSFEFHFVHSSLLLWSYGEELVPCRGLDRGFHSRNY